MVRERWGIAPREETQAHMILLPRVKRSEHKMDEEEIEEVEDEEDFYKRKMPLDQILLELERDGVIEFYEDRWGRFKSE